ncbi:MAG: Geobacillus phage, partial [Bacteroidota bacterium]
MFQKISNLFKRQKNTPNTNPNFREVSGISAISEKSIPLIFASRNTINSPRPISNNPLDLIRLYKNVVATCVNKNTSILASCDFEILAKTPKDKTKSVLNTYDSQIVAKNFIPNTIKNYNHDTSDVVRLYDHPIRELLQNFNNGFLNYAEGIQLIFKNLQIFGNVYIEIELDEVTELPKNLEILPSEYMSILVNNLGKPIGYEFRTGAGLIKKYSLGDILHLKTPMLGAFTHNNVKIPPSVGLYGVSPLEHVLDEVVLMNAILDYERANAENYGVPASIVKYNGRLDPETRNELQRMWDSEMSGYRNAGKTKVFDSDFDVKQISMIPKDMGFADGKKYLRSAICASFGVPIDLIASDDSNRASSETAIQQYYVYTLEPLLNLLEDKLNYNLLHKFFDKNIYINFTPPDPNATVLGMAAEKQDLELQVLSVSEVR